MAGSVYQINKGVNQPMEFRGLKAQFIYWLAGGLVILVLVFAILYMVGVNTYVCLGLALIGGSALFFFVYKLNNTYGEYGMMRKRAQGRLPRVLKSYSRKVFVKKEM